MKKWILGILMVVVFSVVSVAVAQNATPQATPMATAAPFTQVQFQSVNNSGVTGFVLLQSQTSGTFINVIVFGLSPNGQYVSLYYDNHACDLQPDSATKDRVGNVYVGNKVGVGVTEGMVDDSLDEINSVSVRVGSDLTLLACADIHPGAATETATEAATQQAGS